jgi:SOS-response transcriptional repressor LexA/DNA-binding XRE family transcriptional regulator
MKDDENELSHSTRLREIRNALGLNIAAFSRSLGVPRSTLVGWEEGKSVSIDILQILKESFSINLDWFLTGRGEMFINQVRDGLVNKTATVAVLPDGTGEGKESVSSDVKSLDSVSKPASLPAETSGNPSTRRRGPMVFLPNGKKFGQPRNLTLYKYRKGKGITEPMALSTVDPEAVAFIPVYSQHAGAGPGQEQTQLAETEGMIPIVFDLFGLHRPETCGVVQVVGDSMSDISLFNGDWCIFDRGDSSGDGIFVISMYGEMRVKRLQYRISDRKIIIASENHKRYPEPEMISVEVIESGQLIIYGRVFAWFHKHPY